MGAIIIVPVQSHSHTGLIFLRWDKVIKADAAANEIPTIFQVIKLKTVEAGEGFDQRKSDHRSHGSQIVSKRSVFIVGIYISNSESTHSPDSIFGDPRISDLS